QDFEWKLYGHDTPDDLRQRLLAHGLEAEPPESLLVLDLQDVPPRLLAPVDLDIRRIQDARQLEDVGRIQESVWGRVDPAHLAALGEEIRQAPDQQIIYVAYSERLPVAYGRLSFRDGTRFAGLWGGSTLEEYRGLGFYTALLAVRLQEGLRRGARFLTIDAGPMSRPIVEKFGFRFVTSTQPFKWHATRPGGSSQA
ncbi:MAG TPA: GNAT family N-acetyltransferase, partial [Holophaga sp.]|nr:GNAT family N-acetyltransferase [Holophaga sp.]